MSTHGLWWLSLGLGAVVAAVVWTLLQLILASARRIRSTVAEIWVAGPMIAQHTAHLDLLRRINLGAAPLPDLATQVVDNATRLVEHAHGCACCPQCVVGWGPPTPGGGFAP